MRINSLQASTGGHRSWRVRLVKRAASLVVGLSLISGVMASSVHAAAPWWKVGVNARPSVLPAGGSGHLVLTVENVGDRAVDGASSPVMITDKLPPGIEAKRVVTADTIAGYTGERGAITCPTTLPSEAVTCRWAGPEPLQPYEVLEITIEVEADTSPSAAGNEVEVSGGEGYMCEKLTSNSGGYTGPFCGLGERSGVGNGGFEGGSTGVAVPAATFDRGLEVGSEATPFGVEQYELTPENEGGSLDTQAGSHPFQVTTAFSLNENANPVKPPALVKDARFKWPSGLLGDPTAVSQCNEAEFSTVFGAGLTNSCPSNTVVGVASVTIVLHKGLPFSLLVPVFNLTPAPGEPARFGFVAFRTGVTIDTAVRTGGDYGVTVTVDNITETAAYLSSRVTIWGTPTDRLHDLSRGWGCVQGGSWNQGEYPPCAAANEKLGKPFLTLPTSCTGPLQTSVEVDSWKEPGNFLTSGPTAPMVGMTGCEHLPFGADLEVSPDSHNASTPTGLAVKVKVPQEASTNPNGLAAADVKDTTVTLPEGMTLNSAGAGGLQACSEPEIGYLPNESTEPEELRFTSGLPAPREAAPEPFCPEASKIGTVKITTPILAHPLEGAVYIAAQEENPFGSLLAMYLVAEEKESGVLLKLPGEVSPNPVTGQLTTTFKNTPQAPFEDLELHFFGGERAPLSTPPLCKGGYQTTASFTPWSGNSSVETSSEFAITSGPHGEACHNPRPFAPTLTAGATNVQAGGFTRFTMTMSREDGDQQLQGVQLHMPPGLLGMLSTVPLCSEAQANTGTCGEASKIGETIVSVGVGSEPYTVTGGGVYITGPNHGAPYGLAIEEPAKAGPFDLENTTAHHPACDCLVVRAKIEVDPLTAALTVTANSGSEEDAIPTMLEGIPLEIKHVNVTINRSDFTFNPTDCNKLSLTGSLSSAEGASSSLAVPFQVTNCAALAFKPTFAASTAAHNTRTEGASLKTTVTYPSTPQGSEADIAKVKVSLPAKLPARLSTLQKACTEQTFAANPANCPAAARVGEAKTSTPVLPNPLSGPAYFVSHGGTKYPELVIVLQGDNVTIDLHGETAISKSGVLTSTFNAVPDAPFSSFELNLPEGAYSALTANGANLCKAGSLTMPTELTAQDGAVIKQSTKVKITGCPKKKKVVKHKAKKGKRKGKKK